MGNQAMKKMIFVLVILFVIGCQRGDFKATIVAEGQAAPHAGWNIGPDLWVEEGGLVRLTGVVVRVEGLDPNDIFE